MKDLQDPPLHKNLDNGAGERQAALAEGGTDCGLDTAPAGCVPVTCASTGLVQFQTRRPH